MEKYKPGYLGKVIPVNDQYKTTDFIINKYDAFSKIYDNCKDQSENISDIKVVENNNSESNFSLSVKLTTTKEVVENIKESVKGDNSIKIDNGTITAE